MMILKNSCNTDAAQPQALFAAGGHTHTFRTGIRVDGTKRAGKIRQPWLVAMALGAFAAMTCAATASAHAAPMGQDTRAQAQSEHATFLEGFPDVPYITGFEEDESARLIFDTPAGTIAQTDLWGPSKGGLSLFADTLQNMGWSCEQRTDARAQSDLQGSGDSDAGAQKVAELMCTLPDYRLEIDRITEKNDRTLYRLKSTPQPED